MWKQVRDRLLSGVALLPMVAWLACSVGIAVWVVTATGIDVRAKGAVGLVVLIFLVPIGVVTAVDEFVIRRIKYGPPVPGRHKRGDPDPDQLRSLDHRLKRRDDASRLVGPPPGIREILFCGCVSFIAVAYGLNQAQLGWQLIEALILVFMGCAIVTSLAIRAGKAGRASSSPWVHRQVWVSWLAVPLLFYIGWRVG